MSRSDPTNALCYPLHDRDCAEKRLSKLKGVGVLRVVRLLGKGHSSTVLEVELASGARAALKILRIDSKRDSLLQECSLMKKAYPLAPEVITCGDDYVVMELVSGTPAVDTLKLGENIVTNVLKILSSGRGLDILGVDHEELSRADKHVVITHRGTVKILDYESASPSDHPRNLCRLISWTLHRVLGLDLRSTEIASLLRKYKETGEPERREVFRELVTHIRGVLENQQQVKPA